MATKETANNKKIERVEKRKDIETNEIFIGNKPFMRYVIATMIQLKNSGSAIIKARGKFISRGVDIAEVVKKRVKIIEDKILSQEIIIGTESFKNEVGKDINVSTIEISLNKLN